MTEDTDAQRLSRISTCWSLVFQAHRPADDDQHHARERLLLRYTGAVYRYACAALRDPAAAEEVTQEFALRFVRGDFRAADPSRGRFRNLVKTVLFHLIVERQRRQRRDARVVPLADDLPDPHTADEPGAEADREFLRLWREELLECAWQGLAALEETAGRPYFRVLRLRAENPDLPSEELARRAAALLGKAMTGPGVRQVLHRAREKFAVLLWEEVARSLQTDDRAAVEEELTDLGLLVYCRPVLPPD